MIVLFDPIKGVSLILVIGCLENNGRVDKGWSRTPGSRIARVNCINTVKRNYHKTKTTRYLLCMPSCFITRSVPLSFRKTYMNSSTECMFHTVRNSVGKVTFRNRP